MDMYVAKQIWCEELFSYITKDEDEERKTANVIAIEQQKQRKKAKKKIKMHLILPWGITTQIKIIITSYGIHLMLVCNCTSFKGKNQLFLWLPKSFLLKTRKSVSRKIHFLFLVFCSFFSLFFIIFFSFFTFALSLYFYLRRIKNEFACVWCAKTVNLAQ